MPDVPDTPRGPVVPPGHHPPPRADAVLPTVLTYLQMVEPPARPPAARQPAPDVELRRVFEPSVTLDRWLYNAVGRPWLWYERNQMPDDWLLAYLRDPGVELWTLTIGGEIAGYAELDSRQWPDVELAYFGVLPAVIGKGYGPWMLDRLIDIVWARGPKRFWVHTNLLDHPRALDRYKRAVFVAYKTEAVEYRDPRVLWPDSYPWP